MKKILFALVAIFTLGISNVSADNDKLVSKSELPAKTQQFLDKYFANVKITYAKLERDLFDRSYEVVLADGTKLEFTYQGEWKDVDCKFSEVPAGIIPAQIADYVKKNYPDVKIVQIDRDRRTYEVSLSNKLELKFDSKFKLIDIDD